MPDPHLLVLHGDVWYWERDICTHGAGTWQLSVRDGGVSVGRWVNQGCKLGVFAKYSEIMARVHWGKLRYGLIDARAEKFPTDMHTVLLGSI